MIKYIFLFFYFYSSSAFSDISLDIEIKKNINAFLKTTNIDTQLRGIPHEKCFLQAAKKFHLPVVLLAAIARGESNFDENARSDQNAIGVMQIQWPETAKHMGIKSQDDLKIPCINIHAGAEYLIELLQRYNNDLYLSLAAYNFGPGRIKQNDTIDTLPEKARWYANYIYDHLQYILWLTENNRVYKIEHRLYIMNFNEAYRAKALIDFLKQQYPTLRLSWHKNKNKNNSFTVVMLYRDDTELQKGKKQLREYLLIP